MGIAASVLDAVNREMLRYPGCRPSRVGVRIGKYAGVDGESVRFCFDILAKDSRPGPIELVVEDAPGEELDFAWLEVNDDQFRGKAAAA